MRGHVYKQVILPMRLPSRYTSRYGSRYISGHQYVEAPVYRAILCSYLAYPVKFDRVVGDERLELPTSSV